MTRVAKYTHTENIPASDSWVCTLSDKCALWRVYARADNGGFRVSLEYGLRSEFFSDEEASRRAVEAIDVRKIDGAFSAVSIRALQEESSQRWAEIKGVAPRRIEPKEEEPQQELRLVAAESVQTYSKPSIPFKELMSLVLGRLAKRVR